jgi:hypothetical protein
MKIRIPNSDHIEILFLHDSRIRHFWKGLTPVFSFGKSMLDGIAFKGGHHTD